MLPAAGILGLLLSGSLEPWERQPVAFWESLLPVLLCFVLSVCYHTCMAHHQHYKAWILLDVRPPGLPLDPARPLVGLARQQALQIRPCPAPLPAKPGCIGALRASLLGLPKAISCLSSVHDAQQSAETSSRLPQAGRAGRPQGSSRAQVLGIFLVMVASMHRSLLWGFPCHPRLAAGFTAAYYATALAAVLSAAAASTAVRRGLPMLGLLLVRLGALGTRLALASGSQRAVWHYVAMEVRGCPVSYLLAGRSHPAACRQPAWAAGPATGR